MNGQRIDWDKARRQLEENQAALEKALVPGMDRIAAVYRERALQLAGRKSAEAEISEGLPYQLFSLSGQSYGLELPAIVEILPFTRCAPVPGAPPEFLGVVNVRGELRAAIDLLRLLGQEAEEPHGNSGFLILIRDRDRNEIGVYADNLGEIRHVRPQDLLLPPESGGPFQPRYFKGLTAEGAALFDTGLLLGHPVFTPSVAPSSSSTPTSTPSN
jgi:purine-binding chemotaxis protein CheW